ncbi:MAG TPA: L-lactate permease [Candidatus Aminicenantes bacterium]|nr:L-lactate permease [Candidatus Aminicenantes bacterium]HRY64923.1 L-lactate permease [Candidatus Aminicenantes bacterium]HRZ71836.1 L-lactate permease [Candidatus Aminicenantes bacterium]
MAWRQVYDPLGSALLSTLIAALPIALLLGGLAVLRLRAHIAALAGLGAALLVAVLAFGMPAGLAARTAGLGAAYGLFPIGWIILNVIFLYDLTCERGHFKVMQESLTGITRDRRLQLLLIAFSFGAFFEGAAGFGTPVAVTAAILIGLGFSPLTASGLSLIANTAPVAFGALGTPIVALAGVTGLDLRQLSAMVGRQLPFFSMLIPFWLVWAYCGFRKMIEVWPALLVAGVSFAAPQFLISNLHGPWLAGVGAAVISMAVLVLFLLKWKPRSVLEKEGTAAAGAPEGGPGPSARLPEPGREPAKRSLAAGELFRAWLPWIILSLFVFFWGIPQVKAFLDGLSAVRIPVPGLDRLVFRMPPVVPAETAEPAVFAFNWLSFTGTSILAAALVSGLLMGFSPARLLRAYGRTLKRVRYSLLTVAAMLALGYVTRYAGLDATLGLAFARTGVLYPFFGTLLGWLGVALTGSDTSSNVLFGSLQKISAQQLGLSPVLMASANSAGGVMGKMIDAQSIVVASTATGWYGHEGRILRFVFFHSLALAALMGLFVLLQAYVYPFTRLALR